MSDFFLQPVLNSPYEYPARHWRLDEDGQPTTELVESRRVAEFVTPVPKPSRRRREAQREMVIDEGHGLSGEDQQYDPTSLIGELRRAVDGWRALPNPRDWQVTPETARLLQHWRRADFPGVRPFFCQLEAVETAIFLSEVAPKRGAAGRRFLEHLERANERSNPELARLALKLATGAGKTTVMAMLIAWQTINAVRRPSSRNFTRGFLVVTPGITIRDRLRVLLPNDPENYYEHRQLVPRELLPELQRARVVITNYHAFKRRETVEMSAGARRLAQGRTGPPLETLETEGQMLKRVMPELMGMRSIIAINDEAHHCYRGLDEEQSEEGRLTGEARQEAQQNSEAARLWISGLEAVQRKLGLQRVFDLSATPFFLRGSGYAEGTLFPWTMSDFSLMDAIECGIVKLPRVPVSDNYTGTEMPIYRDLWENIRSDMPRQGRGKAGTLDPLSLPPTLETAIEALYEHYERTFEQWGEHGREVPPCFIVVCNNTATSKLVYDYLAGFARQREDGTTEFHQTRFPLFSNFDEQGRQRARPRTLLIDSEQLESGEALDRNFRQLMAAEIDLFRRELVERTGDIARAEGVTDQDLLREMMNTVGKPGRLGESIRCVVSVSMLTEGWDANTVTHILGLRAFGTQLLCEQVVGRALRRQSYELNEEGLFDVEYADILGVPFDFATQPVLAPIVPPPDTIRVEAVSPARDDLEIRFPRVAGYRVELPDERVEATFTADSTLELTPDYVGPTRTRNQGIIGAPADLTLQHLGEVRETTLVYELTRRLLETHFRDADGAPRHHLFRDLTRIVRRWLNEHLVCKGDTFPAQLKYQYLADLACERISAAITAHHEGEHPVVAVLDAYNPVGSTRHVAYNTSKPTRWRTHPERCHINWVICDGDWESEFARAVEQHPRVRAYVKNDQLGLEVPYRMGGVTRAYLPDFIVLVDDGRGKDDPLHLLVEIKGYRGEDAKTKHDTMQRYWIPAVNRLRRFGRWAHIELTDLYEIEHDLAAAIDRHVHAAIEEAAAAGTPAESTVA